MIKTKIKEIIENTIPALVTLLGLMTIVFCVIKLIEVYGKSPFHTFAILISVIIGLILTQIVLEMMD